MHDAPVVRLDEACCQWAPVTCPSYIGVRRRTLRRFGFSTSETVTIMGAHNLGKARPYNSGFNGPWVNQSDQLGSGRYGSTSGHVWAPAETALLL